MGAFGIILKMLISKRLESEIDQDGYATHINDWSDETYKPRDSLVHKSFIAKTGNFARDARKLSKLSVSCTSMMVTINQVLKCLPSLRVVRRYGHI